MAREPSPSLTDIGGYRVIRTLAKSAAGDVLLAAKGTGSGIERTFVLRVVAEKYARDEWFAKAFARAAAAHGRLTHPRIVQVHELLEFEGRPVLVLEHVDGAALNRLRGMLRAVGYGIDDTAALAIAAECFGALAAAHSAKDDGGKSAPILHQYLSPSKVLIGWDGSVKVRDFGLPEPTNLNPQGFVGIARGADGYMAPEQASGKEITPRTDVYAAAIILWELLTKRRAFRKTRSQMEMWHAMAEPQIEALDRLRADVDGRLRDLVRNALNPRVRKRAVTAQEITGALRELVPEQIGREHIAGLMAMVRHQPSPILSELPPGGPADVPVGRLSSMARHPTDVRAIMPTVDTSAPAPAAKAAVPANLRPDPRPSEPKRTSSAKIRAVAPAAAAAPPALKRTSSGKMAAVKPPALPTSPKPPRDVGDASETADEPAPVHPASGDPSSFASLPRVLVGDFGKRDPSEPPRADLQPVAVSAAVEPAPELGVEAGASVVEPESAESGAPASDLELAPLRPSKRSRSRMIAFFVLLSLGGVAAAGKLGHVRLPMREHVASQSPSSPTATATATPAPPAELSSSSSPATNGSASRPGVSSVGGMASALSSDSTPAPAIPPGMGLLKTTDLAAGRRIFVDERTVGETPESILVKCGSRSVKVGSAGRRQVIDIPCGGEITVGER